MLTFLGHSFVSDDLEVLERVKFLQVQRPENHGGLLNNIIEEKLPGFWHCFHTAKQSVQARGGSSRFLIHQGGVLRAYSACSWDGVGLVVGDPVAWELKHA